MMTNADRAEKAGEAFRSTPYYGANGGHPGDRLTDLYDFICDLLHYADHLGHYRAGIYKDEDSETPGRYVARMALWHYDEELDEERREAEANAVPPIVVADSQGWL